MVDDKKMNRNVHPRILPRPSPRELFPFASYSFLIYIRLAVTGVIVSSALIYSVVY